MLKPDLDATISLVLRLFYLQQFLVLIERVFITCCEFHRLGAGINSGHSARLAMIVHRACHSQLVLAALLFTATTLEHLRSLELY